MNSQTPFKELINACKKGREVAQKELYRRYFAYGMTVCVHYTQQEANAKEVLNDAFCRVLTNIKKYNENYPFKNWLRRIIINSAINYHKKYRTLDTQHNIIPITEATLTYNRGERKLSEEDVLLIIRHLSPAYQLVFMLYVVDGYTHQEISDKLGISVGTSKSNYAKARAKLRKLIAIHFPDYHFQEKESLITQKVSKNGQ